ncbi:hypothetical protein F5Y13DRAFT_188252 [Hypoxylon sp. FL1857]|nr:hypothetical protein F5Y13DRAFT_188252 [Hypoxylon sp. FL1857]
MKSSLVAGLSLSLLAPSTLALHNRVGASSPVYILKTSEPATVALSKALDTLGYTRQGSKSNSNVNGQIASSNAYIEVTSDAQLTEISAAYPEAKFIVPQGSRLPAGRADPPGLGTALWGLGVDVEEQQQQQEPFQHFWANHTFFEERRVQGLLELDVLALESGAQAENWVALCEFLGMGYSVVERLGLWRFPK